ncbi:MAG: bifunctional phosphoribosyl-AMP cyclohydrolase/phosphoribosyl-ATP diphosphatase HisIE [Proteobacteria bacterium]|nr:bifunctional phosphoribosyl-AMP cyclohydrolase/phosphoribosyl-ATP diphosphatase HisIE [Pseudomonadota bacterium]
MRHSRLKLNWKKEKGLIPAIVQDAQTGVVLMLGYMNQEALERTLETRKVWFYSRSKGRLWMKGETSGNTLELANVKTDCDKDALLVQALPKGPTCHTGSTSCFKESQGRDVLNELYAVLIERKQNMPKGSYTAALFTKGLDTICEKVDEESGEVIQAAKEESKQRVIEESVDVLYHLFVLLVQKGVAFSELLQEVKRRRKP